MRLRLAAWGAFALAALAAILLMIGRPLPGFVADEHGFIGATDPADWPGPRAGLRPHDRVLRMDGAPFDEAARARVAAAPAGTPFRYELADGRTPTIPSNPYTWAEALRGSGLWWLAAVVHLALGAWVAARRPGNLAAAAHWRYCQGFALFLLGGCLGQAWHPGFLLNYLGTAAMLPAILELATFFPERPVRPAVVRAVTWGGRAGAAGLAALAVAAALDPAWWVISFDWGLALPTGALGAALAAWTWIAARRGYGADARAQARLALAGLGVSLVPSAVYSAAAIAERPLPGFELAFLGFLAFPAAIAAAIAYHRAFDLDRLLRRATLYALLAAALGALYALVAAAAHAALGAAGGLPAFLAALALAAAFRPLHDALRRGLDRLFLGDRPDPLAAAAALAEAPGSVDALLAMGREAVGASWLALGDDARAAEVALALPDGSGVLRVGPRANEMPYGEADRQLLGLLATHVARAQAQQRLARAHDDAQARAEARETLLRQVVHDLGTDLSNIAIATDLARGAPDDPAPLASIDASLARIGRFLDEKRAAVKPGAPAAVEAGVALALAAAQPQAEARGVTLEAAVPPGLGRVGLTEVELAQAIGNMLSNAIRHAPAGTAVALRAERRDGDAVLAVADAGPGIPADLLPAFGSGRRAAGGTGLGLANVVALAHAVGGRAGWRNGEGGGAIVEVTLPLLGS